MSHSPGRRRRRALTGSPLTGHSYTARLSRLSALAMLALLPGAVLVAPVHAAAAQEPAATTGRIAGTVLNEGGQPVGDVQVVVTTTGGRVGAVTNAQGRYNIGGVPAGTATVRAQRIGFQPRTQTVAVAAGQVATLDFQLTVAATTLTEVRVQAGYTNEARRDVSGAITQVTANEIRDQKVATIEEALRGRAPGVQIQATGQPGRPAQIIIRGQNGFNSPNPLYVVDGMYLGNQNPNLNPDDIATLNILKDASAAAQYGSQASNGVIVITTRRGQAGANQFAVNTYAGFQSVARRLPLASTTELAGLYQQAYANAGTPASSIPQAVTNPTAFGNTDWQDAVFRNGSIQNYNLQASGGTSTASYLLSGSVFNQNGAILNTDFRRYSARVNSQAQLGKFTVGENVALSGARQNDFANGIYGGQALPLIDVATLPGAIPVRDPNNPGGYGFGTDAAPSGAVNPVAVLEKNYKRQGARQVIGSAFGEVRLVEGLRYRVNLGVNYADSTNRLWTSATQLRFRTPILNIAPGIPDNTLQQATPNATNLLWENLLTYDGDFGGSPHRVTAVAGQTSQRNQYNQTVAVRHGFTNEQLQQIDAGSSIGVSNVGYTIPFRVNSLLSRATYAYRDRYLATGSVRRDCSSRFSPGNKCGVFGAGSLGWVVSEEGFFKNLPGLNSATFFKLRASTGVLGDQQIGDLRYFAPVTTNINYANTGTSGTTVVPGGATITQLINPNLKWQRNRSTDVGLDLGLFSGQLSVTADYYSNVADQVLVNLPLPAVLASSSAPAVNAGKVKNAGFELGLQHRLNRGAFQLNTNLNLTTTANRVLSLGTGGQPIYAGLAGVARTTVGEPIGSFYVRRTNGIFQSDAEVQAYKNAAGGLVQPNAKAGDVRYVDVNGNGVIDDNDRTTAGSPIPKFITGLFFDSHYRSVDFGLNLRGNFGQKVFNAVKLATETSTDYHNLRSGLNPWSPTSTSSTTPRLVFGDAGANGYAASDRWIENANFVRVQNVILGYTLPEGALRRLRINAAGRPRVYVNAQNLFTITHYSGYDPEVLGFGDPLARGIDDGLIYPNLRTVSFGVDVRF